MSAYVVSKPHVDALVLSGLWLPDGHALSWLWPRELTVEQEDEVFVAGVAISEGSVALANERRRELTSETADRVGAMLWSENVRSVAFRYDEPEDSADLPGPIGFSGVDVASYVYGGWTIPRGYLDPVRVLSAIRCYEYQACEHPGWQRSEAFAYCEALSAIAVMKLPGYREAPWNVEDLEAWLGVRERRTR